MSKMNEIISPLARAKNHGSAKDGTHHFWMQRLTALANVFLMTWLVFNMASLVGSGADLEVFRAFVAVPFHTILLVLIILNVSYHAVLGLQVVIEDYVKSKFVKYGSLIGIKFGFALLTLVGLYSILKISFL